MEIELLACNDGQCYENWSVSEENSSFYRLYQIKDGEVWCIIDGKTIELKVGHLYLFPINKAYSIKHNPDNPADHLWFHFKTTPILLNYLTDIPFASDHVAPAILFTLRTMVCLKVELKFVRRQLELFFDYLTVNKLFLPLNDPKIEKVLEYINHNYRNQITTKQLSKITGYNSNYFIKYFSERMGQTPHKYIQNLRLKRACELLSDGKRVQEVAQAVGYADSKLFTERFKKFTKISPSKFKNMNKKDI